MCVILIKKANQEMPSKDLLYLARERNPHGAGFMWAENNAVRVKKGFMNFEDFYKSFCKNVKVETPSIIHFRISTQAGVSPEMCHPYPLTRNLKNTKLLNYQCDLAIAHNGIITLTADLNNKEYNDTALFIVNYLSYIIRYFKDIDQKTAEIQQLIGSSKLAMLDKNGNIHKVGDFYNYGGYEWSNLHHIPLKNYIQIRKYWWDDDTL